MRHLKAGQGAPVFSALTHDNRRISLNDFLGRKVWLAFLRTGCPVSNAILQDAITHRAELEEFQVSIVAVFPDPASRLVGKFSPDCARDVTAIADPNRDLFNAYGLEPSVWNVVNPISVVRLAGALLKGAKAGPTMSFSQFCQSPAHFLIDEDGMLRLAYYGANISDHLPWWKIRRFAHEGWMKVSQQQTIELRSLGAVPAAKRSAA